MQNFKQALFAHTNPRIDTNFDGEISEQEASIVTRLNLQDKNISDLTGIAYFTNLEKLYCSRNLLTVLEVAQHSKLTTLNLQ